MKITFLGTGTSQGIPLIACSCYVCQSLDYRDKRLRTSVMVEDGPHTFVVDAGPDFRLQMLRNNVRKLDGLLITHEHKDHVAGLDDVRAFNYIQNKSMPVFGLPRVLDHIRIEFAYAFAEKKYPGVPQIELIDIGHDPFSSQGFNIIPIPVMHAKLPILGFRFGDFAYITDCNYLSPESMELIRGSKVLVLNALQKTHHISHYTLEEAIAVANVLEVPQVYFTHISHRMGLHKEVEKELPSHIRLANDGLIIEI
ncbi:MAG TPA: MBL fold metallo-hydrolase [Catalimonadaceae bacterium]|nr:MBL fold metallo-hydrolase [Catalimonadaceae bacterium]HPI09835.1 MBL fold metallo-hydrolase [Catalimonadaceae bacterium]